MDCAGALVNPAVGAQRIFFALTKVVQLRALVDFQLGSRKLILQIFLIIAVILRRNAARIGRNIFYEGADRRLSGLVMVVEVVIDALHDEVGDASGDEETQEEIQYPSDADVAALVIAVSGHFLVLEIVVHAFSGIPRGCFGSISRTSPADGSYAGSKGSEPRLRKK